MAADPKAVEEFRRSVPAASGTEFGRNVSKGILTIGETALGFTEALADIVGADTAKGWLKEKGDYLAELNRAIPQAVEDFTQIKSPSDMGAYAAAAIGQLAPQIAVSFGAGLLARVGVTGTTALVRGVAGALAPSYVQESGGIFRGIREETGKEAPLTALGFGVPAAGLEVLTPARFLGRVFDDATDEVKRGAWRSLVKRSFSEAGKTAVTEGATEAAQESIAVAANKFADSTYSVVNGKNFIRVLDAGLRGAIGGSVIGAATPAISDAVKSARKEEDDAAKKRIQQQGAQLESARDVSVVQAQRPEERAPIVDRGQLRGPAPQPPEASAVATQVLSQQRKEAIRPEERQETQEVKDARLLASRRSPAVPAVPQATMTVESVRSAISDLVQRYGVNVDVLPSLPDDVRQSLVDRAVADPQAVLRAKGVRSIEELAASYGIQAIPAENRQAVVDQILRKAASESVARSADVNTATGQVRFFADGIQSERDARQKFFHEVASHLGLEAAAKSPTEIAQLDAILGSAEPRLMAESDAIAREGGFADFNALMQAYGYDRSTPDGRRRALGELMGRYAERFEGKTAPGWWRRLIGKIKAWLGRIFKIDIGEDGVREILMRGLARSRATQQALAAERPAQATSDLRAALSPTFRTSDIARTAAVAAPQTVPSEATLASGQVTDMLGMFRAAFDDVVQGDDTLKRKVAGLAEITRLGGITDYVTNSLRVNPVTFDQAMAAMPNDGMRTLLSLHLDRGVKYVLRNARRIKSRLKDQEDLIASPGFRQRAANARRISDKKDAADVLRDRLVVQLKNGLQQARERSAESGANQAVFAEANTQIRFYEELLGRVDELRRTVDDMIVSLEADPTALDGIMRGTLTDPESILRVHIARVGQPAATRTPYGERNEALALMRVAADVIARNQLLAQRMLASQWAEDAAISREANDLESRLLKSVDDGTFRREINNVLRSVVGAASRSGKAQALFRIRNAYLVRQLNELNALRLADSVFDRVLASEQFVALRNRAARLVGERVTPEAAEDIPIESPFMASHTVVMPNGDRRSFEMSPDKRSWEVQLSKPGGIEPTLNELNEWLTNPANENDPYRDFYQQQYNELNYLWHGSFALDPPKTLPAFRNLHFKYIDSFLQLGDPLFNNIGARGINQVKAIAAVMKDSMHAFSDWAAKWGPIVIRFNVRAARSHEDIWRAENPNSATLRWFDDVFNPLAASHQDPSRKPLVKGDYIPGTAHVVTEEDMLALRTQVQANLEARNINAVRGRIKFAPEVLVEDEWVPGAPFLRRPQTVAENMLPRRFDNAAVDVVSQYDAWVRDGNDPIGFWREPYRWKHVVSMVNNRDPQWTTPSKFEEAMRDAAEDLGRGDVSEIHDIESLVEFLSERADADPETIAGYVQTEMGKYARSVARETSAIRDTRRQNVTDLGTIDKATAFTMGRGRAIAPPSFYQYGFRDSAAVLNFAVSGNSFYHQMFIRSLESLADQLEAYQRNVISQRLSELRSQYDEATAQRMLKAENKRNIAIGEDLVEFERVSDYVSALRQYASSFNEEFSVGGKMVQVDLASGNIVLSRFVGAILFSWYTLLRNALEGGFYHNGVRHSRIQGSTMRAFPQAGWSVLKSLVPLGLRAIPAGAKAVATAVRSMPTALRELATTGNLIKAEGALLGEAIQQLSDGLFGRSLLFRGLAERGLSLRVTPAETMENIGDLWRTAGVLRPADEAQTRMGRFIVAAGRYAGSFVDAQLALFARPFFPRVGDLVANEAVADSSLSALQHMEARLRRLHATIRESGTPVEVAYARQFTPAEIFGKFAGIEPTMNSLREIELWFLESGLDFHRSISDYFRRLEQLGGDQRWLTNEEKWRLAVRSVEVVNAATPLNRPLFFRKGLHMRMIGALLGWNVNAYRKAADYLGRSAKDKKTVFQVRLAIALMVMSILAWSNLSQQAIEILLRKFAWLFGDPVRPTRLPHEYDTASDVVKANIVYAFNSIPFVATAVNAAFSDLPNKASFSPYLLIQNKAVDLLNWVGGAINSGDITYRLPQLIRGFVPLSSIALNRIPEVQGARQALDATRLYTRYADRELLVRPRARGGPGASANVTPLTPYGDRIFSAIARGDQGLADRLYVDALRVAEEIGKADPEQSVRQMIINRLPISRAFRTTPTPEEYGRTLARMDPSERALIEQFNQTMAAGLARFGIQTEKIAPTLTPRRGRTRGRSAIARATRSLRRRTSTGRTALNRIERRSLVRSSF